MHLPRALHRHPRSGRAHRDVQLLADLRSARNLTRGTVLAARCERADSFLSRGIGLLGRARLGDDQGLLITRTNAITMLFMRFAIDAVFIDRDGRVVRAVPGLRPWVPMVAARAADAVLEVPVGTIVRTGTQAGDVLIIE